MFVGVTTWPLARLGKNLSSLFFYDRSISPPPYPTSPLSTHFFFSLSSFSLRLRLQTEQFSILVRYYRVSRRVSAIGFHCLTMSGSLWRVREELESGWIFQLEGEGEEIAAATSQQRAAVAESERSVRYSLRWYGRLSLNGQRCNFIGSV